MDAGTLIWITGLSGAGKTTLATGVVKALRESDTTVVHLDGDIMREILGGDWGHTREDRERLSGIYARLCSSLTSQGITVVISAVALFHSIHEYNRAHNPRYLEVLVTASQEELHKRREIYGGGKGHVVGQHIEPEFPTSPHLTLMNDGPEHIDRNVQAILEAIPR